MRLTVMQQEGVYEARCRGLPATNHPSILFYPCWSA